MSKYYRGVYSLKPTKWTDLPDGVALKADVFRHDRQSRVAEIFICEDGGVMLGLALAVGGGTALAGVHDNLRAVYIELDRRAKLAEPQQ